MSNNSSHFFGQIGINSTPITIAIEEENFALAEELIKDTEGEFLDDGPYENIPLKLVLSNNRNRTHIRNLYLAKLLVERGANANLLIPHFDMDGTFSSPFQDLVVYYESLKEFLCAKREEPEMAESSVNFDSPSDNNIQLKFLTFAIDLYGQKCDPTIENCFILLKETKILIDIFLKNGADPNVVTTFSSKTLFHWVVERDVDLCEKFLLTASINCNIRDCHGNSPLMDAILKNPTEESIFIYDLMCEWTEFLDLNCLNCSGENSFALACFVGSPTLACRLYNDGASIDQLKYNVIPFSKCCPFSENYLFCDVPDPTVHNSFLSPLISDSPVHSRYTVFNVNTFECSLGIENPPKNLIDKIIHSSISPIVDSLKNEIPITGITSLLTLTVFSSLKKKFSVSGVLPLMFGYLSAGLKQLCIRTIIDHVICISQLPQVTGNMNTNITCVKSCKNSLKTENIEDFVSILGLPPKLCQFFEIEVAKYQLCHLYMCLQRGQCTTCNDSSESLFGDEDTEMFESSEPGEASSDYEESHPFSSDMSEYSSSVSSEGLELSDNSLSQTSDNDVPTSNSSAKEPGYEMLSSGSGSQVETDDAHSSNLYCNFEEIQQQAIKNEDVFCSLEIEER